MKKLMILCFLMLSGVGLAQYGNNSSEEYVFYVGTAIGKDPLTVAGLKAAIAKAAAMDSAIVEIAYPGLADTAGLGVTPSNVTLVGWLLGKYTNPNALVPDGESITESDGVFGVDNTWFSGNATIDADGVMAVKQRTNRNLQQYFNNNFLTITEDGRNGSGGGLGTNDGTSARGWGITYAGNDSTLVGIEGVVHYVGAGADSIRFEVYSVVLSGTTITSSTLLRHGMIDLIAGTSLQKIKVVLSDEDGYSLAPVKLNSGTTYLIAFNNLSSSADITYPGLEGFNFKRGVTRGAAANGYTANFVETYRMVSTGLWTNISSPRVGLDLIFGETSTNYDFVNTNELFAPNIIRGADCDSLDNFIIDMYLTNVDKSKSYAPYVVSKNYGSTNLRELRITNGTIEVVGYALASSFKKKTGYEKLFLSESNSSGMVGWALVNWDALEDGYRQTTLTTANGYKLNNNFITKNPSYYMNKGNISIGNYALRNNVYAGFNSSGDANIAIGHYSQENNYGGSRNTSIGNYSLYNKLNGSYETFAGYESGFKDKMGLRNTGFGYKAIWDNEFAWYNTAFGFKALEIVKATGKLITAWSDAGGGVVTATSATHGLLIGDTIMIIGTAAYFDKGDYDNYDGEGYIILDTTINTFNITAAYIDPDSLFTMGAWKIDGQGEGNLGIGYAAGDNITTGNHNIAIGYNADVPSATANNQLSIQNSFYGDLSNNHFGAGIQSPKYSFHGLDFGINALSADPIDPDSGNMVMWVSDGSGSGDVGDVMMKINVGGTVKVIILVDYSAF